MAYTIKVTDKNRTTTGLQVSVEYKQGQTTHNRDYLVSSKDELDRLMREEVAKLESLDTLENVLTTGVKTVPKIVVSPPNPEPETPTEEQIKQKEYEDKLADLQKKTDLVNLGIITSDDLTALKKTVKDLATEVGAI